MEWSDVVQQAQTTLQSKGLPTPYQERLKFEIQEIEKQGAEAIWVNRHRDQKRFASNPNNLVLPWMLGMVDADPIAERTTPILNTAKAAKVLEFKAQHGSVPHDLLKDPDSPDIDLDCLPFARDPLKQFAIEKYGKDFNDGYGSVCSVGTWTTYKFKSALQDAAVALGKMDLYGIQDYTTELPDDVDELREGGRAPCKGKVIVETNGRREEKECGKVHNSTRCECGSEDTDGPTIGKLLAEHTKLQELASKHPEVIEVGINLIGRVRSMGMHAGAIIITDRPLYGNVPMARSGRNGYWVSMWTEGRNTQLSKFGYIKWDLLGLKTLGYLFNCCKLVEENRGISFGHNMSGWDDIDPTQRRAGHFFDPDGNKHYIDLDDRFVLDLANAQKTDGVFQFDTDLAKSILANKSTRFEDLMLFNAMGHPGPMASIPEAVKNRDEDPKQLWKKRLHPLILEVLEDTYGVIVYQEQLQAIWQRVAGFTAPEAQEARKAVAKKLTHKLKPIREKWINGAARMLGQDEAEGWWPKMETFGRYAFNKSHAVSYCLMAHRCLWFKAHFAPEFWASVMSDCHPDKLVRYMGVARAEGWSPTPITNLGRHKSTVSGVSFQAVNIENMTTDFTVTGNTVNQGLIGIKGLGESATKVFQGRGKYANIDEFVTSAEGRQSKIALERFIKLGAFRYLPGHENDKALWTWYLYKYCNGKDITALRKKIKADLLDREGWDDKAINMERQRQIAEWKRAFPKRNKVPDKFKNWQPKPIDTRERVMALYADDEFTLEERLDFQKQFLGYWLESPMEQFHTNGGCNIAQAKVAGAGGGEVLLEGMILDVQEGTTKTNKPYLKMFITDGIQRCLVFIWNNELSNQDFNTIKEHVGVSVYVEYDQERNTFSLARGELVNRLKRKRPQAPQQELVGA